MEVIVMKILASCDLRKALNFNGKLVLPNEDEKRPDKVMLNVVIDSSCEYSNEEVFQKVSELDKGLVKCITFMVEDGRFASYVPTDMEGMVFNEYSLDYYIGGSIPMSMATSIIRLPKGYSDMRTVLDICKKDNSTRVIGGYLLGIEGIRVGRFNDGKDKMSPVFRDIYDTFVEVDLNDLDGLQEIVKKTRKRAERLLSGDSKRKPRVSKPKVKKVSKRVEAFNSLFSDEEGVEF